jgi:L-asparagine transporter-like permease
MFAINKYAARFQIIFTTIKVVVVISIISIGIVHIVRNGKSTLIT